MNVWLPVDGNEFYNWTISYNNSTKRPVVNFDTISYCKNWTIDFERRTGMPKVQNHKQPNDCE